MAVSVFPGDEGRPNVEVIILVCTGAAATFLWLMLILFIRKLRKVRLHRHISDFVNKILNSSCEFSHNDK